MNQAIAITDMACGTNCVINCIKCSNRNLFRRLTCMGLSSGTKVRIEHCNSSLKSVIINVYNSRVALEYSLAKEIMVNSVA